MARFHPHPAAPLLLLAVLVVLALGLGGCSRTDQVVIPGGSGDPFAGVTFGDSATCDIITWNLHNFPASGTVTVDAVAAAVAAMRPDIAALQEVNGATSFQRVVAQLPGYAGYRAVGAPGDQNLAYLYDTRTVAVDTIYELFPGDAYDNPFPRRPLVLEGSWLGHDLVLVDNHLKCCGDGRLDTTSAWDEETRRWTAAGDLHDYIETHWPDRAVVLLGDLNDSLTDPPADNVFQVFLDDPAHYRFTDMTIAEGPATYWSWRSQSHLDHVLVTDELFAAVDTTVTLLLNRDFPTYYSDVSDHRPVGLRLAF